MGIGRYVEMDHSSSVVAEYDEDVQNVESDVRHREEFAGGMSHEWASTYRASVFTTAGRKWQSDRLRKWRRNA